MVSVLLYVKRGRHIGLKSITEGEGVNKLPKVHYRIYEQPLRCLLYLRSKASPSTVVAITTQIVALL